MKKNTAKFMHNDTRVTKCGLAPENHFGVVNPPVYHASTILFPDVAAFEASEKTPGAFVYARSGSPATRTIEEALAELDGADHAIVTSSGLSAIVTTLTTFLSAGDHLLASDAIYGSMRKFCEEDLKRFGVEVTYFDPLIGEGIAALIQPNTKLVYCESPGSLTFEVEDIPAIVKAAHARGVVVAADNTWATPLFLRAADLGVDVTIHSCTKYIGGHSDLVMGLITTSKEFYPRLRNTFRNLGACAGSEEIYLAQRGLRSMAARLKQHQETGLALAHWFKTRPEVAKVYHPALPDCPGHAFWKRDFKGSTGLFTVLLNPCPHKALAAMIDGLDLFGLGYSWGGFESLMIPFKPHRTATPSWTHKGPCIRVHAGLEHVDDLICDLEEGFTRLKAAQ